MKINRKLTNAEKAEKIDRLCNKLVDAGIVIGCGNGFIITPLGRRTEEILDQLTEKGVLGFIEKRGTASTKEIVNFLMENHDSFLNEAIRRAKQQMEQN